MVPVISLINDFYKLTLDNRKILELLFQKHGNLLIIFMSCQLENQLLC